MNKRAHVA